MAAPFNIIAQLQLQAPTNLSTIVGTIQSALTGITATVNITINPASIAALGALNAQLTALTGTLAAVQTAANSAAASLGPIGGSLSRVRTSTVEVNQALVATPAVLQQVVTSAKQAGDTLQNFGIQAGLAARRYSAFLVAGGAIIGFVNELRNAIGEAVRFQREMIRLSQVGDASSTSLREIESSITRLSTGLGVSSRELLGVAQQLRQAGFSANDTKVALDGLAKTALAPSFGNLTDTTEGLISALSQFKLAAADTEKVLGAINAVSTRYAVSSRDIIDAVRRMGGAFHSAGGDLNELIALFGAVRSTSRESAESIGSSMRTILVRTQRSDFIEQMHQLGIELRYTTAEAEKLGRTDLRGQFVGPYEAVRRLSEATKGLRSTDPRFTAISEQLGGYRQISKTIPLLQEFAKAQEIYKTAQGGANSLTESSAKAQDAFLVKITKVREEFAALIRTVTESKGFQVFLDLVIQLASGLTRLASVLTPLIPLFTAIATIQLGRGLGRIAGGFLAGAAGKSPRFATGGVVPGIGDGDTVPAMLEPGEFVIRKQAAKRLGYDTLHRMNIGNQVRRYAEGGKIPIGLREGQSIGQLAISGTPKVVEGSYDLEQVPESPGNPFRHTIEAYAANSYKYDHDKAIVRVKKLNPQLSNADVEAIVKEDKGTFKSYVQNIIKKYKAKASVHNMTMKDKHDLDIENKSTSPLWRPIATGIEAGIQNITQKPMKSSPLGDKNFTDSVSGFLLEGIVSAHTGLEPGGGKSSVDFRDIRGSVSQLRPIINLPSQVVPNNIDTKTNLRNPGSIVLKALSANLFDTTAILQDIQRQAIQLPGAEQIIGGRTKNVEALHAISANIRRKAEYASGGVIQSFADGGNALPEDLQSTFKFYNKDFTEPVTTALSHEQIAELEAWRKSTHGPLVESSVGKYVLPGKAKSITNVVGEGRGKLPEQAVGEGVLQVPSLYMITTGGANAGGPNINNLKVTAKSLGISEATKSHLLNKTPPINTVSGRVNVHVISDQALDEFNQEFMGPVGQAIKSTFASKFATGKRATDTAGIDFALNPSELKTISGIVFQRYISGLFSVQGDTKPGAYFDYPGPFPNKEGLSHILYPKGPVVGEEGDAKLTYSSERTHEVMGKWLNKYAGEKFASGGKIPLLGFAQGGTQKDTVPALLTPGEYVINKDAAQRIGYGNLHAMNQTGVARYAKGGPVRMATGGRMAGKAQVAITDEFDEYVAAVGVDPAKISSTSRQQVASEALAKLYEQEVENARKAVIASGKVGDNMEATRMATEGVENNFAKMRERLKKLGSTDTELASIGLGGADIKGEYGTNLRRFREARGALPKGETDFDRDIKRYVAAGQSSISFAEVEHATEHRTVGQESSLLTQRQVKIKALNDYYDKLVKQVEEELRTTGGITNALERERLAHQRAAYATEQLAKEASLEIGGSGPMGKRRLQAAAEEVGAPPQTRRQALRAGLSNLGQRLYEHRGTIATGIAASAAYYGAQALENTAGTADESVLGGEATQDTYIRSKSGAGLLQGAATGAAAGSFIPGWGTAVGAVVGGLGGLATSLHQATEEILKARIELAGKRFGVAAERYERGEAGAGVELDTNFKERNKALEDKRGETWYKFIHGETFFGGATEETRKSRQEAEFREANAPFVGTQEKLLSGALSRYARSNAGPISMEAFGKQQIGEQSIDEIISEVSRTKYGPGADKEKMVREQLLIQGKTEQLQAQSSKGEAKTEFILRDWETISVAIRNATTGLNDLARQTQVMESVFSGTVNAVELRNPAEGLGQLGGARPDVFAQSVQDIATPLGERGQDWAKTMMSLDTANRRFTAGLPDALKGYTVNPMTGQEGDTGPGEALAFRLEKILRGGKGAAPIPGMEDVIDNMHTKLARITDAHQIGELVTHPDKLRQQILGEMQQGGVARGEEWAKQMKEAADAFSKSSARFQQQLMEIGKVIDEQSKTIQQATQIRGRGQAELAGTVSTYAINTPLAQQQYAFTATQQRLTGEAGLRGQEAFDPKAIGQRQREVQAEIASRQQELDKKPGFRGGPEWDAAVDKIHQLERVSANLGQALTHLGQVSERNAAIEERLNVLRKDEESRTSLARRFLSGDTSARMEMMRGRMFTQQLATGANIQNMSPTTIRAIEAFAQAAPNALIKNAQGQQTTVSELVQHAFANVNLEGMLPGFGNPQVNRQARRGLLGNLAENADVAADALGEHAGNLRKVADQQRGIFQQGGAGDIMPKLNENLEHLNENIIKLREALVAGAKVPTVPGSAEGGPIGYAYGGKTIFKPKGTDTVPAMLTPNEFVVNARSAQANKTLLERINAARGPIYLAEGGLGTLEHLKAEFRQQHEDEINPDTGTHGHLLKEFREKRAVEERERKRSPIAKEWAKELEEMRKEHRQADTERWWKTRKSKPLYGGINQETDKVRSPLAEEWHREIEEIRKTRRQKDTERWWKNWKEQPLHGGHRAAVGERPDRKITSHPREDPRAGFALSDVVHGHIARTPVEQAEANRRRNVHEQGSQDALMNVWANALKRGEGDVYAARRVIEHAEGVMAGAQNLRSTAAGVAKTSESVGGGLAARLQYGGGGYERMGTGRIGLTQQSLTEVGFRINAQVAKKHNTTADVLGDFFGHARVAKGAVPTNPMMAQQRMITDSRGNLVGKLVPGTDIVITDMNALAVLNKQGMGAQTGMNRRWLDGLLQTNKAVHLNDVEHRNNWKMARLSTGGIVPGTAGGDISPTLLTPGEFVLNSSAARALGYDRLQALNVKYLQEGGSPAGDRSTIQSEPLSGVTARRGETNIPASGGANFGADVGRLQAAFNSFAGSVQNLRDAVSKMPSSVSLTGNHTVTVNFVGAEVLAGLGDKIKEMISGHVTTAMNHMIGSRFDGAVKKLDATDAVPMQVPETANA